VTRREKMQLQIAIGYFMEDSNDGWEKGMRLLFKTVYGSDSALTKALDGASSVSIFEAFRTAVQPGEDL